MKSVEILSILFGEKIKLYDENYYTFPTNLDLLNVSEEKLMECKAGFRCKYILKAAEDVCNNKINLDELFVLDTIMAKNELIKLLGVGLKVAECVLLFSGIKYDVFPVDVWIKRIMEIYYFERETSILDVRNFGLEYFGQFSGFAQQYLFYYAREHFTKNNIKNNKQI